MTKKVDIMFDIIIIANIATLILIPIGLGSAKFIIKAGLKLLNEYIRNMAVCLLILRELYVSFVNLAPTGQPQNILHTIIKGIFSLKFCFVILFMKQSGIVNASMFIKIELIIEKGSNVGKMVNNQRFSPLRAYSLVIFILASIKKNIKSIENVIKFFFIIW